MKKSLVLLSLLASSMFCLAQQGSKPGVRPANFHLENRVSAQPTGEKSLLCSDTLRYSQAKEQILGTNNFFIFSVWESDAEAISMTYLLSGGSVSVSGVEFLGASNYLDGTPDCTVRASIYSVDGSYTPVAQLATGTVIITDTNLYYVNFPSAVTVTGNYAVVLEAVSADGVLDIFVNDAAPSQSYDETLARAKSDFYAASSGAYIGIPAYTSTFPGGPFDFEPILAPIVSYTINTQYTASATSVCQGTPVTYTNGTTPTSVLTNRMMNYQVFRTYFGTATSDSTYVYDMDNMSPYIWSGTTTYTHPAAGSYDVLLATNGGFWNSCFDYTTQTITVNAAPAAPTVTASGSLALCDAGTVTLTSSAATGNTWSTGETTQAITVNTAGTYTVTETAAGCTSAASAPQVVTVGTTPATPTVTASGSLALCPSGSVTLTSSAASGNTWSTGETTQAITVNAAGTYTVTATATGCTSPASADQTVTMNPLDDATFAYPTNTICSGSANQTPTTSVAGTFAATPAGLTFTSTATGEIDVNGSSEGTYSVTYTTSGTCPNTSNQTIVITTAPDAAFTYAQASYCTNGTNPSPVFGAGASAGTFSSTAGLMIDASTGVISLTTSTAGTYTVTNAIAASGSCAAASETFDVTIAETPTATVSGGGTQCGPGSLPVNIALTGAGPWDITYTDGTTPTTVTAVATSPYTFNATANGTFTVSNVTMGACSAAGTGTASVVFNTNPTVTFTQVADICDNASAVTLVASPAGGTFSGSTGVSGTTFNPSGLTAGSITLTYNYTDANNCSGSATSTFTLNAAPDATLGTFDDVCLQAAAFGLTGGLPAGGTYSGTGVTGGNFNPATAGEGSETITYTVTANGCTDAATQTITVEDCAGIEEAAAFGLEIYPNPATSVVTIKTGKDVTFSMVSEDGKVVYPASSLTMGTETQLEVSHLAKGIYFLNFSNAQGSLVQKVIVQ